MDIGFSAHMFRAKGRSELARVQWLHAQHTNSVNPGMETQGAFASCYTHWLIGEIRV